jgi:hypothetical protein
VKENIARQSVLFNDVLDRPLRVQFDERQGSSDGGAILLKAADERLGLSKRLSGCIEDARQPGKVQHSVQALFRQRLFAIACGFPDGNDAARLAADPVHQLLVQGRIRDEMSLASQPTLSRFENATDRGSLYQMNVELAETVLERHVRRLGRRKVHHVTIDMDPTDDPTHGAQQLSFFNAHYDTWCYLPMACFVTFNHEPEQYLFGYVLRPGNATGHVGAIGILSRAIERVRERFPRARILVRLDGGFAGPEMLNFLEEAQVDYILGIAENAVLKRRARRLMGRARVLSQQRGKTANVFGETQYAAKSWKDKKRRVIIKAEVVRAEGKKPKDNGRFVVTNLKSSPRHLYKKVYCARGDIENRIKELHHGLEIDRTSCTDFLPNQLRVLITAAAYVLYQELRLAAKGTVFERAQVSTLRDHLIKLGAWVGQSVRRLVLHLPKSVPHRSEWQRIARSLGAAPA